MNLQLTYVTGEDGVRHLTLPAETRAAVIAFVRENGAKPPEHMAAIVEDGHAELLAALEGVSDEQARWKPAPDQWSILEVMDHIVTVKNFMGALGRSLSQGAWPPGLTAAWQEERVQDGATVVRHATLAEARAAEQAAHDSLISFVRTITPDMNTDKMFAHFLFGEMNCRHWAMFQRIHDYDHVPTIAKIKALPAYPR